jgi:hypothetical protein
MPSDHLDLMDLRNKTLQMLSEVFIPKKGFVSQRIKTRLKGYAKMQLHLMRGFFNPIRGLFAKMI